MKKIIAHIISVILGPVIWLPILILLIIFKSGLNNSQLKLLLPFLLFFYFIIPVGNVIILFLFGKVKDLDLSNRKERIEPLLVTMISIICGTIISYFLGNKLVFSFSLLILIILIVNFIITLKWKISLHAAVNVVGCLTVNYFFQWQFFILFLTLPLVFWARLFLKKHTVMQLIAGFVINGLLFLLFLYLLNVYEY